MVVHERLETIENFQLVALKAIAVALRKVVAYKRFKYKEDINGGEKI